MRFFLRLVIQYPMATTMAVVGMALGGIYSTRHMPVDLFPDLDVPVVNIISHHPAAASEDVERLISRPIEQQMRTIPGVRRVASTSVQGISQVTIEFTWGTTVRDARQWVQARLARLGGILPAGVHPRLESIGTTLQEVCGYVVYGGSDLVTLRTTVRHDIVGRLMGVDGVSSVDVLGGDQRAFWVEVRPESLVRLHRSVGDLVSLLKNHNVTSVAGYLTRSAREYMIRGDARLKTLDDIRRVPVIQGAGQSVLLGATAHIYEGCAPRHYVVHGDGEPAVAILVRKQPGASTIRVVSQVDGAMAQLQPFLPPTSRVRKFYDQAEIIRQSRQEIISGLLMGAGLAVIVLYVFLGSIRPTLIVAATIPITLFATVAVMHLFALSFNVITMTALALAIGMIVDDAIVVAENIVRHRRMTSDARQAAVDGAAEIAGPDASGTLTTVAAFLPLVLVTGLASLFLKPFGLTISASMLVSLLLSLTLVPVLMSRWGTGRPPKHSSLGFRLVARLDRALRSVLLFSFRHTWLTVGLAAVFLCAAGLAAVLGKASVLPPIDEGALLIEYVMPPGTSLKESNRIGDVLDRIALADQDVSCVYRRTGSPQTGYQIEGVNQGELLIKLKSMAERDRSAEEVMAGIKRSYSQLSGVVFLYHQPTQEKTDESFSGLPALFGVTIYGTDMDQLADLANQAESVLADDPAITNVVNNTKVKPSQIDVRVDSASLARYGVDAAAVLTTLQAAHFGVEATRIVRQKEEVLVLVKMAAGDLAEQDRFAQLPVLTTGETAVPLSQLAEVRVRHAPAAITRLNGQRQITLLAEVEGNIPSVVSRLRSKLQSIQLPHGYSIDFTGQYKVLIETAMETAWVVLAAVVLIYLVMSMQFGSWLQSLIILSTVPLSLVGSLVALFVTGQGLDVSVGMGAVTLVGIAVNNAIVLVDYANRETGSETDIRDALVTAASVRLRPILLTTLTTIAALVPTAIGTMRGSQIFHPFAITVIGGLVSATFATLILVPTLVAALPPRGARL